MTLVPFLLLVLCVILCGAHIAKPVGYIVVGLAVLALLLQLFGTRL